MYYNIECPSEVTVYLVRKQILKQWLNFKIMYILAVFSGESCFSIVVKISESD